MITNFRQSRLGIDNLHRLIMIAKNWPDVTLVGCEGRKLSSFNEFIKVQNTLLEDNEKSIFDYGFLKEDEH